MVDLLLTDMDKNPKKKSIWASAGRNLLIQVELLMSTCTAVQLWRLRLSDVKNAEPLFPHSLFSYAKKAFCLFYSFKGTQ